MTNIPTLQNAANTRFSAVFFGSAPHATGCCFKPRIGTYDGFEVPVPLAITIQHGDGDLVQVAKDILGLTKLNYNSCQLGEGQPITVKYSDRVGEILLANPGLPSDKWKHNFKYYA
jgi:argonaute-like protein implicated in RNA metabolism and viral defense